MPTIEITPEIIAQLREWAMGHKPEKAAVDFLIATDSIAKFVELEGRFDGKPWVNWEKLDKALEYGGYSSGEYATLKLAKSMLSGDLFDSFWTIDGGRKEAFITALKEHR